MTHLTSRPRHTPPAPRGAASAPSEAAPTAPGKERAARPELLNNAARLNSQTDLSQVGFDDWDAFTVNVYAYFHLVQAVRPHLHAGDAITVTAPEEGLKGSDTMIDYAATKAALIHEIDRLASGQVRDSCERGSARPTWTVLHIADQSMPQDWLAHLGSETPLGRAAQPEEIAPVHVCLASEADSSCTVGENIAVSDDLTGTR